MPTSKLKFCGGCAYSGPGDESLHNQLSIECRYYPQRAINAYSSAYPQVRPNDPTCSKYKAKPKPRKAAKK